MLRQTILTVLLMGGCAVCFVMAPEATSRGAGKQQAFAPVAPVLSLMAAQDYHFEQMKEQVGSESKSRFSELQTQAEIIAELANVNRFHEPDKADYVQWCNLMRGTALEVAKAAKAKDIKKAKSLIAKINTTCNDCHDEYQ